MAYFEQHGAMHGWNSRNGYIAPAPVLRILCDNCFTEEYGEAAQSFRNRPEGWKWAPYYGGTAVCKTCNKPA
jgi:hypothetical protein